MSKAKQKEQWYVSAQPGYCISLPDGVELEIQAGGVLRKTSVIKFPMSGGKMFKTSDPNVIEFIESTSAFRMQKVTRVPTPEEIEEANKKREQQSRLEIYKGLLEKGVPLPFKDMSDTNLRKFAAEIGAETSNDGVKLSKDKVLANVEALVSG